MERKKDIREYFKDVLDIENIIKNETDDKKIIKYILQSDYMKSLNRDLFILNNEKIKSYEEIGEDLNKKDNDKIYDLKVSFRVTLGLRDKKIKRISRYFHKHNCYELVYVYSGTYTQYIGEKCIVLKAGESCLLNPEIKHKEEGLGENDTVFFICFSNYFYRKEIISYINSRKILKNFLAFDENTMEEKYIIFNTKNNNCNDILDNIVYEYFNCDMASELLINGYVIRLFDKFFSKYECNIIKDSICTKKMKLFREIDNYIEKNISNISRKGLAEYFHYNENYINMIIKENIDLTYSEYITHKRLAIATDFLKNGNLSINKIIKEVGYTNKSYFYKIFMNRYGIKPKEFRDLFKNK